jgi:hypothetical protein
MPPKKPEKKKEETPAEKAERKIRGDCAALNSITRASYVGDIDGLENMMKEQDPKDVKTWINTLDAQVI